jgi:1,4-dihydroxy-2-naphthoate octaprenyltransferase
MMAARPKTLPAGVAPVLVGTALAGYFHVFHPLRFVAALLGSVFIQVGTNLSNDYSDARRGADSEDRIGPVRVTAGGLVPPRQVLIATYVTFGLAVLCGVYLIAVAGWQLLLIGVASILAGVLYTGGPRPYGYEGLGELFVFLFFGVAAVAGWQLLLIGVASILAGVLYTGGPRPYGYEGLGELFVFLFFGVAAVAGSYFAQTTSFDWEAFALAVPVGLLAAAILVVNNARDIDTDRRAGKRTLAVRLDRQRTRDLYGAMVYLTYPLALVTWIFGPLKPWLLLCWLSLPVAVRVVKLVRNHSDGPSLNQALAMTGQLQLLFCVLLGAGLLLSR